MKKLISILTMKRINNYSFRDVVTGEKVYFYKDIYGVEWMSTYPYYPFKFRVKAKEKWNRQQLNG